MRPLLEGRCDGKANIPQISEKSGKFADFLAAEAYGFIIDLFPAAARALWSFWRAMHFDRLIGEKIGVAAKSAAFSLHWRSFMSITLACEFFGNILLPCASTCWASVA
jgi:hypothetical protein